MKAALERLAEPVEVQRWHRIQSWINSGGFSLIGAWCVANQFGWV